MLSVFNTSICLAALLAAIYTVHIFREAKLRDKLSIPAKASIRDVGTVEFSADTPRVFHLGSGKDLSVTASIITNEALLATNKAILMRAPNPITNDIFQFIVSYTSKTDRVVHRVVHTEHQYFMGLQDRQVAIRLEGESHNPVAVVMIPRLMAK